MPNVEFPMRRGSRGGHNRPSREPIHKKSNAHLAIEAGKYYAQWHQCDGDFTDNYSLSAKQGLRQSLLIRHSPTTLDAFKFEHNKRRRFDSDTQF